MNKLDEIRDEKANTQDDNSANYDSSGTWKEGWDAAIKLNLHVKFINWTLSGDCELQCMDEDKWYDPKSMNNYTTQEAFDYWLKNFF